MISDRTKKALAVKKRLGFTLGRPENLTPEAIEKGRGGRQQNARVDANNRRAAALAKSMRASGQTLRAITTALNGAGFRTRRGKGLRPVQVQRVVALLPSNLPKDRWRLI